MDIKKLADKFQEQLTVEETKSLLKDLGKLSMDELGTFVESLENNSSSLPVSSQAVLNSQEEKFIADIIEFFNTVIERYGYDGAQTEHVLEQYEEEFAEFAQALSTFSFSEIKDILIKLGAHTTHTHGEKIAEQLIVQLQDTLIESDFDGLVNDPAIKHLY